MIVFRGVLGELGWSLESVRVTSGAGNYLQFLYSPDEENQMEQSPPAAGGCTAGEAGAGLNPGWFEPCSSHLLWPQD